MPALRLAALLSLTLCSASCAAPTVGVTPVAEGVRRVDAPPHPGRRGWVGGWPARAGAGLVHVVVEIPAGDIDKWEVSKPDGRMRWELRDGEPRRIRYLGYPGNYGMIRAPCSPRAPAATATRLMCSCSARRGAAGR